MITSASQDASVIQDSDSASAEAAADVISVTRDSTFAFSRPNRRSLLLPLARLFEMAVPILPVAPITAMVCFVFILYLFLIPQNYPGDTPCSNALAQEIPLRWRKKKH